MDPTSLYNWIRNQIPTKSIAGIKKIVTKRPRNTMVRILSRGKVMRNAPITAATAPLAPKVGNDEEGFTAIWTPNAISPPD